MLFGFAKAVTCCLELHTVPNILAILWSCPGTCKIVVVVALDCFETQVQMVLCPDIQITEVKGPVDRSKANPGFRVCGVVRPGYAFRNVKLLVRGSLECTFFRGTVEMFWRLPSAWKYTTWIT